VIYFANSCTNPRIIAAMQAGLLGMIATPAQDNPVPRGVTWCADNGSFGKGWPGDEKFLEFLREHAGIADRCKFAVAPDVPYDMLATLKRSAPWLGRIRSLGYPVALAVQDGALPEDIPWQDIDAVFLGGSTEWKDSDAAGRIAVAAAEYGKWRHGGRVNTYARLRLMTFFGCDSADGTFLTFGPDKNLARLLRYLRKNEARPFLWDARDELLA
jgi:hypothetical protein